MVVGPTPESEVDMSDDADLADLMNRADPLNPEMPGETSSEDVELQRRDLAEKLSKKLDLPLNSIAIGSAVSGGEAHIRINCTEDHKQKIDSVIDDLQYPLRLLEVKDITLHAPGGKAIEVNTVRPDTLGYDLGRDLLLFDRMRTIAPAIANGIADSALTHLNKCIANSPLDPTLIVYKIVFHKELGRDTTADFAALKQLEEATAEGHPTYHDMAHKFGLLPSCTASGGNRKPSSDEMAQYIREHIYPDIIQTYLIKDVYEWAGQPNKAVEALQEQPRQRAVIERSLWTDTITMVLTTVLFGSLFLFKKQVWKLPDLPQEEVASIPFGWIKPFLIVGFSVIIAVLGFICAIAIAPEVAQDSSGVLLGSYFKPNTLSAVTCMEELLLVGPTVFAAFVLVGAKTGIKDFFKLRFSTNVYSKRDIALFGFQCFILTFTPAMVAAILTYIYHYPWEKPGSSAIELLVASGSIPAIINLYLGYAILGPILEEMAFRGVLHPLLRRKFQMIPSIIISSAAFAIIHLEFTPWWILDKFIFGAVTAYAVEKTNSIVPGIICHVLTNSFVLLIMMLTQL